MSSIPTNEDEKLLESNIKKQKDSRSHQQGKIRHILNKLDEYMLADQDQDVTACNALVEKIPDEVKELQRIHDGLVILMRQIGRETKDVEEKTTTILKAVVKTDYEAKFWISKKMNEISEFGDTSDLDSTILQQPKQPGFTSSPLHSSTRLGFDNPSSGAREAEYEAMRYKVEMMTSQLEQTQFLRDQLAETQSALSQQQRDFKHDETTYQRDISQLRKDLHDMQDQTRRNAEESRDETLQNTMVTAKDLLDITTMMGQTNSSMLKKVFEESQGQQQKFFTHFTGPKAELKSFNGDRTQYRTFVNRFTELVGCTDRSDASKLNTLMEHCGPDVLPYLDSCNYQDSSEGYNSAKKLLEERYGNPFLISQAWMEKISEIQKVRTADQMMKFAALITSASASLKSMGYESEISCTRTMKEIYGKLPGFVQNKWLAISREKTQRGQNASLKEMLSLINNVSAEMNDPVYGASTTTAKSDDLGKKDKKTHKKSLVADSGKANDVRPKQPRGPPGGTDRRSNLPPIECVMCKKNHPTYKCFSYKDLGAQERLDFVEKEKLCRRCLGSDHATKDCRRDWKCLMQDCGAEHHYSLHRALTHAIPMQPRVKTATAVKQQLDDTDTDSDESEVSVAHKKPLVHIGNVIVKQCYTGRMSPDYVVPVFPVTLHGPMGQTLQTNALLDTGSSITMVTKNAFEKLGLMPVAKATMTVTGLNSSSDMSADVVDLRIEGTKDAEIETITTAIVNDHMELGSNTVKEMRKYLYWDHLKHLNLSFHDTNKIDILIGQDQAFLMIQQDLVEGPNRYFPFGIKTRLGWTIYGHFAEKMDFLQNLRIASEKKVESSYEDLTLEQTLEKMWDLDRVPEKTEFGPINARIMKMWESQTKLVDGHLQVPIPFKKEPPCFPDNYQLVKQRLDSLERRLNRDPALKEQYIATMKQNIERGYLEKAPIDPDWDYITYSPHLPVLSDTRTTRCRIVGNLSFRHHNTSLNESVHPGPNLATNIVEVMVGFRKYRYVVTADVEKMFNQVMVPPHQRDSLSILWWKDHEPGNEVEVYRGCTQMFGGTWCPAACSFAMIRATQLFGKFYPQNVTEAIMKGFYVDDLLRSIISVAVGLQLVSNLRELLNRVGFNLIKFGSNSLEILEGIPPEIRAKKYEEIDFVLHAGLEDKTLGSSWRPADDVFFFKIEQAEKPITRRGLLSTFSSIYDPMGFVGPVVLVAKIIIQELCRLGLSWDDEIPEEYVRRWLAGKEDLTTLQSFTVERWLGVDPEDGSDYQLHVFADASENGYGCVVYLSSLADDGQIEKSSLLMTKSKVAPMKSMTIPRLELTAAVLAARLENTLVSYLNMSLLPTVFWTDSKIVLHYIKQQSRDFKTFIANRISIIQQHTDPEQWRHVPSEMNIADISSCGVSSAQLVDNEEWVHGPNFLKDRALWPPRLVEDDVSQVPDVSERKRKTVMTIKIVTENFGNSHFLYRFISSFSQWNKKIRVIAIMKRLANRYVNKSYHKGPITVDEALDAEMLIVKILQQQGITEQQRKSRGFQKLYPYDDEGVMRIGGRLMLSALRFEEKHPAILPAIEDTRAYVRHVHARLGHPGIDRTYCEVRKRYWLLGGRRFVKDTLNKCVTCRKLKDRGMKQFMASLPRVRVEAGKAPFEDVGVDYFGPMYVKIGRSLHKRWGCAIICLKSKAVHIELAADMTTSSFLNALQRFIARRGKPRRIYSDNGTNFVGANNELKKIIEQWNTAKIHQHLQVEGIEWYFNTPAASHHGGIWERMIRSIRNLMLSVIANQTLTDESLATYMCTIEEILNSRPLTKLNDDPEDLLPLTPNHLLMLRQTQGLQGDYDKSDSVKRRWKQLQYLADLFWRKWSRSYLKTLQERKKWFEKGRNIRVGDIVLMMSENTPRLEWPLAIVQETYLGKDDVVRSVKIKTKDGVYDRPVTKLVHLECD